METDELNIQGGLPGRPESPTLETTARLAVEEAIRELIATKLLYQKVEVSLDILLDKLGKAGVSTNSECIGKLSEEVRQRPWRLDVRHLGDDPNHADIFRLARGGQPVGMPLHDMNLNFYAPSVPLVCRRCKRESTFIAIRGSSEQGLGHPYPRPTERGREQVYTIIYRCETCREVLHAVLVRREGMRLHLCGFAPRREQRAQRNVGKMLEPILLDADNAVAEGDLFGGYYHLRTLLEHYMKLHLGIEMSFQIRGDELVAKYNESLPTALKGTLPSLGAAYEVLSHALHCRTGTVEEYAAQQTAICDHFEGVAILKKYQTA